MAWIEVHQALRTHKKTMKAVSLMKFKMLPEAFVGHLTCLWLWCIDNAPDGILPNDTDMIDMSAGCPPDVLRTKYGCPEDVPSFTEILRLSEYIDKTDKGLELHDWEEYTGKLILQREADRLRKQAQRESTKTDIKSKKLSGGSPKDVQRMSAGTQPNQTQHDSTLPNNNMSDVSSVKGKIFQDLFTLMGNKVTEKVRQDVTYFIEDHGEDKVSEGISIIMGMTEKPVNTIDYLRGILKNKNGQTKTTKPEVLSSTGRKQI